MIYKTFEELIGTVQKQEIKKRVGVIGADDPHTLEAVFRAKKDGLVEGVLIGNKVKIKEVLRTIGEENNGMTIVDVKELEEAAIKGVRMVNEGYIDFIMKGKIQTGDLLKAVVNKDYGLRTGGIMSHIAIHEMKNYHKLLAVSDGGMMTYPNLEQKKQIIQNAVNAFIAMGYEKPKVAVLAAVEKVNTKMPETMDAFSLKEMNRDGLIENCIVEGPISYDLTMSRESATIKGYDSPVTGDADVMIVPDIQTGNILGKCLVYSAGAKMAGFVLGAKCPIVLTSRGSTSEEKYLSLALCAALAPIVVKKGGYNG